MSTIKLNSLEKYLGLTLITKNVDTNREVVGGYASDLLSWVMSHAKENQIWITIQSHQNVVAVASLLNLAGIIVADGANVDEETINKAIERNVPIYTSNKPIYELCGMLYKLLTESVEK